MRSGNVKREDHAIILILTRTDGEWTGIISSAPTEVPAETIPKDLISPLLENIARGIAADISPGPWVETE